MNQELLVTRADVLSATGLSPDTLRGYASRGLISRPMKIGTPNGRGSRVFYPRRVIYQIKRIQGRLEKGTSLQAQAQDVTSSERERRKSWWYRGPLPQMKLSLKEVVGRVRTEDESLDRRVTESVAKLLHEAGLLGASDESGLFAFQNEAVANRSIGDLAIAVRSSRGGDILRAIGALQVLAEIHRAEDGLGEREPDLEYAETEVERNLIQREIDSAKEWIDRMWKLVD